MNAGSDDALDSDAMLMNGFPAIMTTTPDVVEATNSEDLTFDFGLAEPVRIGDTVWFDTDRDGVQDSNEFAIGGATVNLFDKTTGALIRTTITDVNGNYFFDVPAGLSITIKLDNPADFLPGGALEGLIPTVQDAGGDDAADSDAMDMSGFGAIMGNAPASGEDLTFDFGFVGADDLLRDGATQRFIDGAALIMSRLNRQIGRLLLRD